MSTARELTFGEKAVGLSFNPGGNPLVAEIKEKYAAIIDELHGLRRMAQSELVNDPEAARMFSIAITEAQTSQMWAVKAATWNS
jgi:hypothetical protein